MKSWLNLAQASRSFSYFLYVRMHLFNDSGSNVEDVKMRMMKLVDAVDFLYVIVEDIKWRSA